MPVDRVRLLLDLELGLSFDLGGGFSFGTELRAEGFMFQVTPLVRVTQLSMIVRSGKVVNFGVAWALGQDRPRGQLSPILIKGMHTFWPLDNCGPLRMWVGALSIPKLASLAVLRLLEILGLLFFVVPPRFPLGGAAPSKVFGLLEAGVSVALLETHVLGGEM